jgi:hypothetical protein
MRSEQAKRRKAKKSNARRKDFLKKNNIKNCNWPAPKHEEEVPTYKKIEEKDGKKVSIESGTKKVIRRGKKQTLYAGDGILPASKKFHPSKEQKAIRKKAVFNSRLRTASK